MDSAALRVVLAGINGYGRHYLQWMLTEAGRHGARLAGVVDPAADRSPERDILRARGIPVYDELRDFYANDRAELAIVSTPIQYHRPHTLIALEHGSNVLCEKPLCATLDEARIMRDAEDAHPERFVAVGFNRSFSPATRAMKADIMAGVYGAPKSLKTLVSWPRRWRDYYQRNNWAGQLKNARGEWILDSPLSNAAAHFLHNMFFVCGPRPDAAAHVRRVEAELYRANPIPSFDTAAVRCAMAGGWSAHFYATHADANEVNPIFRYRFERGEIHGANGNAFVGVVDGRRRIYPADPGLDSHVNKLLQCLRRCRGEAGAVCGVAAAMETTRVVNAAHLSMPEIIDFPRAMTRERPCGDHDKQWTVPGLLDDLIQCYDQTLLPSEHGGLAYARPGRPIDAASLTTFAPPFASPPPEALATPVVA